MISTPKRIVYRHARVCNQPTLILFYYHLLSDRIPAASRRFIVFRNKPGVQGKRKKSLPSSRKTGAAAQAFPDLPLSVTDTLRIPDGHASLFIIGDGHWNQSYPTFSAKMYFSIRSHH